MKLVAHFTDFLKDTVNLNQDRIDTLEDRVGTIEDFLENSDYEAPIRSFSKQGSWAHKTIIRPPNGKEFDADLVVYVDAVEGWTARDYILKLRRVFLDSDRYRDMAILKTRCVRINYAGDFHLDVVPIVVTRNGNTISYSVCNRIDDVFEPSDGDGYAEWWHQQNGCAGGQLKKIVRLLKYLRDIKGTFSIKSVLLTTIAGERITALDQLVPRNFADVPTALKTVVDRLDDWLQDHEEMPDVRNPALPAETFTRKWTQDEYDTFRDKIHDHREWIDEAYDEEDHDESIRKWRRVLGKDFAKGETLDRATKAVAELAASVRPGQDLVAVVLSFGRWVLQNMPRTFPHVEPPPRMSGRAIPVRVVAQEKRAKDSPAVRALQTGDDIGVGSGIGFRALQNTGMPFANGYYKVQWQVVNTDRAAAESNDLRGEFCSSSPPGHRYETTKYRGVHWVQAFLINKRTGLCDGVSERFFVVIR